MTQHFANYHSHRAAFRRLFDAACDERILLLQGASGTGKTSLIKNCLIDIKKPDFGLSIQLRNTSVGLDEILARSAAKFGIENLPTYKTCNDDVGSQINLSNVEQIGGSNTINVALHANEVGTVDRRNSRLTEAWFNDMRQQPHPVVIVFDTYEHAPSVVQDWIAGPFLSRVADNKNVRVAIAGQRVPVAGIEWGAYCSLLQFDGVPEPEEWLPVIQSMGKTVPEPASVFVAGICHALKGHPSEIMKIIEAL